MALRGNAREEALAEIATEVLQLTEKAALSDLAASPVANYSDAQLQELAVSSHNAWCAAIGSSAAEAYSAFSSF